MLAGTGVIFAAVYLLWMVQRVFFGKVTNSKNKVLADLSLARDRADGAAAVPDGLYGRFSKTVPRRASDDASRRSRARLMHRPAARSSKRREVEAVPVVVAEQSNEHVSSSRTCNTDTNVSVILPELVVATAGVIVMLYDSFLPRQRAVTGAISIAGAG